MTHKVTLKNVYQASYGIGWGHSTLHFFFGCDRGCGINTERTASSKTCKKVIKMTIRHIFKRQFSISLYMQILWVTLVPQLYSCAHGQPL